jgi:glyoxylase I family protein
MDSTRSFSSGFFFARSSGFRACIPAALYTGQRYSIEPMRGGVPMKPIIRDIDHVGIRAANPEALKRFYCDALGCESEKDQPELGLTQLRAGRALIDLLAVGGPLDRAQSGAPGTGRNMDHLCLRVENYDPARLRVHLEAHGATLGEEGRRYGAEGYGPSLYLFDPEGNMVELKGPPETLA